MAGKTDAHSDSVLNILRNTAIAAITTVYAALFTVTPSDSGGGTESSYGSDTRKAITFTAPEAHTSGRKVENDPLITWTSWDGTSPETFVSAGVFDALTVGNLLYWAALTTSRTINTGESATFAVDALRVTED